jgi:hypothetical protein
MGEQGAAFSAARRAVTPMQSGHVPGSLLSSVSCSFANPTHRISRAVSPTKSDCDSDVMLFDPRWLSMRLNGNTT